VEKAKAEGPARAHGTIMREAIAGDWNRKKGQTGTSPAIAKKVASKVSLIYDL